MRQMTGKDIKYDAFISYRHCELDSLIAETLHKKLEHYHIPRAIRQFTGRNKVSRIFRDKEELPLSANLSDNIYDALNHSEFLILICSPESMQSEWVQREVAYFVKTHGKKNVLTVLVRGEPEEAFPRLLCEDIRIAEDEDGNKTTVIVPVEPLAADVRGKNKKESLRKLNTEILRLLAAMLGCTYDGLKQRHREYFIKRSAAVCSFILTIMLCFAGYAQYQKNQIALQHRESLQSQAKYLSEQSVNALKAGDREEALKKAIEISSEGEEEPFSPWQLYALNRALYSFKSGTWKEYAPEKTLDADNLTDGCFSENGRFYCAVSDTGQGFVFSGETGELLWTVDTRHIEEMILEGNGKYSEYADGTKIYRIIPYQEDTFLLILPYAACVIDADSCEVLRVFPMNTGNGNIYSCDLQGDIFTICTDGESNRENVTVYNLAAGECLAQFYVYSAMGYKEEDVRISDGLFTDDYSIHLERSIYLDHASLAVNEKNNTAALGISARRDDALIGGLYLYDYEDNINRVLSEVQTVKVLFADDEHLAAIHREPPKMQKSGLEGRLYYSYYLAVYDVKSGKQLYTGEKVTTFDAAASGLFFGQLGDDGKTDKCIILWLDNRMIITDFDTGDIYGQIGFDSNILSVNKMSEESLLVGTEEGWFQEVTVSDSINRYDRMELSAILQKAGYNKESDRIAAFINGKVVFGSITSDSSMKKCGGSDNPDKRIQSIEYAELNGQVYRLVKFSSSINTTEVAVYEIHSDNCLCDYVCGDDYGILKTELFENNGEIYMYLVENNTDFMEDSRSLLHMISLSDGNEIKKFDLQDNYYNKIAFNQEHSKMICETSEGLTVFDISGERLENDSVIETGSDEKVIAWEKLNNCDRLFCAVGDYYAENGNVKFFLYDISSGSRQDLDLMTDWTGSMKIMAGKNTSRVCICDGDMFHIIDCEKGSMISQISLTGIHETAGAAEFSFFDEDDCLLFTYGDTVFLYDANTGNLLNSLNYGTSDALLDMYAPTLQMITDSSNSYFALKDSSYRANPNRNTNEQYLYVFFVDEDMEICPYAEVSHGYASLAGQEISVRSINYLKYTSFYDYAELKEKAEMILARK